MKNESFDKFATCVCPGCNPLSEEDSELVYKVYGRIEVAIWDLDKLRDILYKRSVLTDKGHVLLSMVIRQLDKELANVAYLTNALDKHGII